VGFSRKILLTQPIPTLKASLYKSEVSCFEKEPRLASVIRHNVVATKATNSCSFSYSFVQLLCASLTPF